MKKIIYYLRDYGLFETIKRIFIRILGIIGLIESETYVLRFQLPKASVEQPYTNEFRIMQLDREHVREFNRIKYFDFIDGNKIINSKYSRVFIAMESDKIIGYVVCFGPNVHHQIHKMGTWKLGKNEAWIGPTFIVKKYRNKGIHKVLLIECINTMYKLGIEICYTAINKNNIPSIRSFSKVGFDKLGLIKIRRILNCFHRAKIIEFNDLNLIHQKFIKR